MGITKFVDSYLAGGDCPQCKQPLALKDLLSVGVQRPSEDSPHDQRPLAVVVARCPQCGNVYQLTGYQTKEELLADVGMIFEMLMALREVTEKPSTFQKMIEAAKTRGAATAPNAPVPSAAGRVRPSRRKGTPEKPPTKAEIEQFIRRLKHASFRRSNGGFERWLKRLGGNTDASGGERGDDAETKPPF